MRRNLLARDSVQAKHIRYGFAGTAEEYLRAHRPVLPVNFLDYASLVRTAAEFTALFPGTVAYAVKANPTTRVIDALNDGGGIDHFELTSLWEIQETKRQFPNATMCFMHPVKPPEAIKAAYRDYGVRTFALDCKAEIYRIVKETGLANDLELHVRIKLPPNPNAGIDFSSKIGAPIEEAAELLRLCRPVSRKLGVSFHVGTQNSNPKSYETAIGIAADLIRGAGVNVDVLNVGGGFPSRYPSDTPIPPLADFMKAIKDSVNAHGLQHMELMCEPGRAMVSQSGALAVRVERRKDTGVLHLNDGTYAGLFDAGLSIQQKLPVTLVKPRGVSKATTKTPFTLFGPTCDSVDRLYHTYDLPDDVAEGDYLLFGSMGSYCVTMRTNFNGFGASETVWCHGLPTV